MGLANGNHCHGQTERPEPGPGTGAYSTDELIDQCNVDQIGQNADASANEDAQTRIGVVQ